MLVQRKNCSNPNPTNEQFQLVVLFVPPQGDQFNYFLFGPSPLSKKVGGVFFFNYDWDFFELTIPSYTHFLAIGV
jgi:hypothetical protein